MIDAASWRPIFVPADDTQRKAVALFERSDVLFLLGGAGSGKTHVAVALALLAVADRRADKVILTRPTVECGDSIGYIPGGVDEKLAPWLAPVSDVLGNMTWATRSVMPIEPVALQHIRGRTLSRCVGVLDEAQNVTRSQMVACLTRLGRGGKLILAGDPSQCDLETSALPRVADALRGIAGVGCITLRGQHRHDLIPAMLKRLEKVQ